MGRVKNSITPCLSRNQKKCGPARTYAISRSLSPQLSELSRGDVHSPLSHRPSCTSELAAQLGTYHTQDRMGETERCWLLRTFFVSPGCACSMSGGFPRSPRLSEAGRRQAACMLDRAASSKMGRGENGGALWDGLVYPGSIILLHVCRAVVRLAKSSVPRFDAADKV